ncbi:MAG TPA: hypothetical protein VN688_11125 [Gemmataceae bacterium]|nr:hypothetical protein [Gemmataceae bacterium]
MEDVSISGRGEGNQEFKQFLSQYDGPAYLRRARAVQGTLDHLLASCRRQRAEWLKMARLRIGMLHALAGEWTNLRPLLADEEQLEILRRLHAELAPQLRVRVEPTSSLRALRRALRELRDSLEHFNQRWRVFLPTVDLMAVNELRDGYNRYYVLEKECVVRSARIARQGFVPLEPLTIDDLTAEFPPLFVPRLRA